MLTTCQDLHNLISGFALENGADVNARDKVGLTALMATMGPGGSRQAISTLLEYKADVNISSVDGQTSLMWASTWWDVNVVKSLLEKGAEVNVQRDDGATVLHIAAKFYRAKIVKLILDKGGNPLLKTKAGKTPLMLAQESYRSKEQQGANKFVKSQLAATIKYLENAEDKKK